jgi:hypothetical protein
LFVGWVVYDLKKTNKPARRDKKLRRCEGEVCCAKSITENDGEVDCAIKAGGQRSGQFGLGQYRVFACC